MLGRFSKGYFFDIYISKANKLPSRGVSRKQPIVKLLSAELCKHRSLRTPIMIERKRDRDSEENWFRPETVKKLVCSWLSLGHSLQSSRVESLSGCMYH